MGEVCKFSGFGPIWSEISRFGGRHLFGPFSKLRGSWELIFRYVSGLVFFLRFFKFFFVVLSSAEGSRKVPQICSRSGQNPKIDKTSLWPLFEHVAHQKSEKKVTKSQNQQKSLQHRVVYPSNLVCTNLQARATPELPRNFAAPP